MTAHVTLVTAIFTAGEMIGIVFDLSGRHRLLGTRRHRRRIRTGRSARRERHVDVIRRRLGRRVAWPRPWRGHATVTPLARDAAGDLHVLARIDGLGARGRRRVVAVAGMVRNRIPRSSRLLQDSASAHWLRARTGGRTIATGGEPEQGLDTKRDRFIGRSCFFFEAGRAGEGRLARSIIATASSGLEAGRRCAPSGARVSEAGQAGPGPRHRRGEGANRSARSRRSRGRGRVVVVDDGWGGAAGRHSGGPGTRSRSRWWCSGRGRGRGVVVLGAGAATARASAGTPARRRCSRPQHIAGSSVPRAPPGAGQRAIGHDAGAPTVTEKVTVTSSPTSDRSPVHLHVGAWPNDAGAV